MFYEIGCYGRIALAELPRGVQDRLAELPGEWLEFDPAAAAIVVRHTQPSSAPCLPTITGELVRIMSEIPAAVQPDVKGGDLFVHTESKGQLVRLRVEPGGTINIAWAQPDYGRAGRRLWRGSCEGLAAPAVQCLNGSLSFETPAPGRAAREIEQLADNFEGLYPEGEFAVTADESKGRVEMSLRDLNLDVKLLLGQLDKLAAPGSLAGRIDVSSFAAIAPEQSARFLVEQGQVWIQRPVLWPEPAEQQREATA
jgi:hypothetical protein